MLRLVGASGTNKIMAGELSRLCRRASGVKRLAGPVKSGTFSVVYPFDREVAYLAAHYHRTAARVLWDVCQSRAERLEPLYDELKGQLLAAHRGWLFDGATISVTAKRVGKFAAGERQLVGVVKNAVIEAGRGEGMRVSVDAQRPDVPLVVHMADERVIVSVDLAGGPMHRRGYRQQAGPAPLKENLAAVMLMLARYDARHEPVVDPMAGSGTIAIEACAMARAQPLWVAGRQPALHALPAFRDTARQPQPLFSDTVAAVWAADADPSAIEHLSRNARAAGVDKALEARVGDLREQSPAELRRFARQRGFATGRGLIVSNPPYGARLHRSDLGALYRELAAWCRRFSGWRAAFLVANPEFERHFGRPRIRKPLSNGPLRSYFYLYEL